MAAGEGAPLGWSAIPRRKRLYMASCHGLIRFLIGSTKSAHSWNRRGHSLPRSKLHTAATRPGNCGSLCIPLRLADSHRVD